MNTFIPLNFSKNPTLAVIAFSTITVAFVVFELAIFLRLRQRQKKFIRPATWTMLSRPANSQPLAKILADENTQYDPYEDFNKEYYHDLFNSFSVTLMTWNDIRFMKEWQVALKGMVEEFADIDVAASFSGLTIYQEDPGSKTFHTASQLVDPWDNIVCIVDADLCFVHHSMINTGWQNYIIGNIRLAIEQGIDEILIDELAIGSLFYPDFTHEAIVGFQKYLKDKYATNLALKERIEKDIGIFLQNFGKPLFLGSFENIGEAPDVIKEMLEGNNISDNFDYKTFVKKFFSKKHELTIKEWRYEDEHYVMLQMPLANDFWHFLRLQHKEMGGNLRSSAKSIASENSRLLPFSTNVGHLLSAEALLIPELLDAANDYLELEWDYTTDNYFPAARASCSVRLARAFGLGTHVLTAIPVRTDLFGWQQGHLCNEALAKKGSENSKTFYQLAIADAHAAGGTFHLEQGDHCVRQDTDNLQDYYCFSSKYPNLFEDLIPAKAKIGVLLLFESLILGNPYDSRDYRGIVNMLTDSGYQFDVIFAAEKDYSRGPSVTIHPAPSKYSLSSDKLSNYSAIIIPALGDIIHVQGGSTVQAVGNLTNNHASKLLDYLENNSNVKLIVFATVEILRDIKENASSSNDGHVINFVTKLHEAIEGSNGCITYENGKNQLCCKDDLWAREYLDNQSGRKEVQQNKNLRNQLGTLLSFPPEVTINTQSGNSFNYVGAYAYRHRTFALDPNSDLVVHLVNYDYNEENKDVTPVTHFTVTIIIGDMFPNEEQLTVKYYLPESASSQPHEFHPVISNSQDQRTVTIQIHDNNLALRVWAGLILHTKES